jgi:hypothetical protein
VYSPALLGSTAADSPHWPGAAVIVMPMSELPANSFARTMVLLESVTRTAWPALTCTTLPSIQLRCDPSSTTKESPAPVPTTQTSHFRVAVCSSTAQSTLPRNWLDAK